MLGGIARRAGKRGAATDRGTPRAGRLVAVVAALAALLAFAAASAQATEGSHERFNGSVTATCNSITFAFKNFANAENNTVAEKVFVHGVLVDSQPFTFNGPTGTNTIPISVPVGPGIVDGEANWNTNGLKGGFDIQWTLNCSFPAYTIEKLQRIQGSGGEFTTETLPGEVGQTVEYEILLHNTGNTVLTFSKFTDGKCSGVTGPTAPINPGESTVYLCSHKLVLADTSGYYVNQASVTGSPPKGQGLPITKKSNTVAVRFAGNHGRPNGEVYATCSAITFSYKGFPNLPNNMVTEKVFVHGTLVLTKVFTFNGPTGTDTIPITVPPGYGGVDGEANWNTNGFKGGWDIKWELYCPVVSGFGLQKSQTIAGSEQPYTTANVVGKVGQTIDYRIVASNVGNVPLTFGPLSDSACEGISTGPVGAVQPGADGEYTCTHTITEADQTAGSYANTATLTGTPPAGDGSPITHESDTVVTEVQQNI